MYLVFSICSEDLLQYWISVFVSGLILVRGVPGGGPPKKKSANDLRDSLCLTVKLSKYDVAFTFIPAYSQFSGAPLIAGPDTLRAGSLKKSKE